MMLEKLEVMEKNLTKDCSKENYSKSDAVDLLLTTSVKALWQATALLKKQMIELQEKK